MREILGRRLQWLRDRIQSLRPAPAPSGPPALLDAALTCATAWEWPVLPGVGRSSTDGSRCACPDPDCVVPGAHPFDPGLLAATTDPRMVTWWWTNRPAAPVLMATGGAAPCAVSLPATAAARALVRLDAQGLRLGPVVATPTRWSLLVAPYSLERLGELLYAKDHVPSSLRFHGEGGYLLLPPSAASGGGEVRWEREPRAADRTRPRSVRGPRTAAGDTVRTLWLPDVEAVVDALVEASTGAPGGGSRLAY
ncbi:bifunctional DNA primase/polymerase [Streptomyces subrutilus]|uniref:DNA primase n=1 Tax=Streptomyces subrutilus TaxID=36818 RepID=A0A5P2UL78_9ACTN|nr:bifunctional DNA primase/polymerase [Streptomyces subrutilus]QEU79873.1 DNA primase [Streptomyces subrutilus]WSJ30866.1 bifunctional DNA primase/polymerase [Streptomyces subrutilus]GGZ69103.1 DNA primase [Streptomyces subrutilus]